MIINPMNVINLLLATFQTMYLMDTPVTRKEVQLKEIIQKMLLDSMFEFNEIEVSKEWSLDFLDQFKECEVEAVDEDDADENWSGETYIGVCSQRDEDVDVDYKRNAVAWTHQIEARGTRKEWLAQISEFVITNSKRAIDFGYILHDRDIRRWALQAYKEQGNDYTTFKASKTWLYNFKKAHRIMSRKVTKFVTRKPIEDDVVLKDKATDFVNEVKPLITRYGHENLYNSDQSGFQLEIHSGRTLAVKNQKKVDCVIQSVPSTSHSYTIQPTITADRRLLSPLFMVLQEANGQFGPIVQKTLFKPTNVYVIASKSGKLTSAHFKIWLEELFFTNTKTTSVLLLDSWSGHCEQDVCNAKSTGKEIINKTIPKGTTGRIQPLDVYGFRVWKNYVQRFSDDVLLHDYDVNLHLRNNVIKLQSLVHNQLSSPRYKNLFQYAWYKSGYTEEKSDFVNPVDFIFEQNTQMKCALCDETPIIRCSWCKKAFCLKHFFHEYHFCDKFEY
ncbi:uncharacterized protein LOC143348226 [Colletes latitarsis]|uniref:uncharacterized protein LOC143348226 n=1 Tax=Colletes latitarsis TaxID=2605962 RepID=UPI0040355768